MSDTIDQSFVKQFESEVHLAYQRMGSRLVNTVRRKTNITGKSTTFQKIGKGTAGTKSRHGQVPLMNLSHTPIEVTLTDYYAGEFIDALDELKINHDERMVASNSIAYAMGRKSDEIINTAAASATNSTGTTGGLTKAKVEEVFEAFGNADVPDDGERYMPVSPQGWTDLMGLVEFSSKDYVPESEMPYRGGMTSVKRWNTFMVFMFSGLTKSGSVRTSMAYHRSAIGHASGQDTKLDITWQGKEQANLAVGSLSQGAKIIDDDGIYLIKHTEV